MKILLLLSMLLLVACEVPTSPQTDQEQYIAELEERVSYLESNWDITIGAIFSTNIDQNLRLDSLEGNAPNRFNPGPDHTHANDHHHGGGLGSFGRDNHYHPELHTHGQFGTYP